ncbi:hypothetical protein [Pseudoalteromonas mariniglutinosa]|uniref:hypothetical protein n=1 Tax=Pseudoalteromonas mariniglutinosa TaxID=206042 RepID=UPI00384DBE44
MMMKKYTAWFVYLLLMQQPASSLADEVIPTIKPPVSVHNINAVNLNTGHYAAALPVLSIPAAPRLTFESMPKLESKINVIHWVSELPFGGKIAASLSYGGSQSDNFTCLSECRPIVNNGTRLIGGLYSPSSSSTFSYKQGKTGRIVYYSSNLSYVDNRAVFEKHHQLRLKMARGMRQK